MLFLFYHIIKNIPLFNNHLTPICFFNFAFTRSITVLLFVYSKHDSKNDLKGVFTMQMQNMQAPIPNPPRAITTKDLLYIKDVLSWELMAFKKFHFFAQQVSSPELKQVLEKIANMHQNHFQRLLPHLQVNNNAALASLPNMQQMQQSQQSLQ
jgi:hypothetical protein